MMALVRICGQHWHAVERDLMELNWLWSEDDSQFCHAITGVSLKFWRFAPLVLASPPGTAIYHAETRGDGPWSPEVQMLSRLGMGQQNVPPAELQKFNSFESLPDYGGIKLEAFPADELVAKRKKLVEAARKRGSKDRAIRDVYRPGQSPVMVG